MAHYAYKHACYDIDYEKFDQLVEKYKAENNGEYDGDSNYNGDNWYIMAMWIRELRAENESLTKENEALKVSLANLQEQHDHHFAYDQLTAERDAAVAAALEKAIALCEKEKFHFIEDESCTHSNVAIGWCIRAINAIPRDTSALDEYVREKCRACLDKIVHDMDTGKTTI